MTAELKKSLESKRAMRKRIAGKSFTEKLRLLEALRDRQRDIIASRPGLASRQLNQVSSVLPKS